jgi:signal transduction histidine kinase
VRILENLCTNAVKYGDPFAKIAITTTSDGNEVEIKVHNFGQELSEMECQQIFEKYRRTSSAKKGNQQGWGIGLTLVRGLLEAHGGKISVESLPQRGTTFTASLPC